MCRVLLTIFMFAATAPSAFAQPDKDAGRRAYEVCAGCHGFLGEGNQLVGAPRLAGIETWYLERQILAFRAGQRGYHESDANGRRMALLAQAVEAERELDDLLAWIASLPGPETIAAGIDTPPEPDEAARGRNLYAACSACHGATGEGNAALGAPALVPLDNWYVAEQLKAYANGLRGTHAADSYGAQMRTFSAMFDTDEERTALAGYISGLNRSDDAGRDD